MKRKSCLLLCFLLFFTTLIFAQTREDAARDDLDYSSRGRQAMVNESGGLWYGAGAQLGFRGGNNFSFFQIGVSPMVGYKLNNFLSAGPRVSVTYNSYRDDLYGIKDKYFSWSAGVFARAKIYRGLFAHGEYSLISDMEYLLAGGQARVTRAIPFLGAGFNQGGGPGSTGFELLLLFRLTQPDRLNDAPYELRTGFNYNF
ncbi:hypothetical protein GGR28_002814 [Lewinella aquimaris]|uniref:Outer membrane protein beta-barrel domain-containing protein n=1 Tax=Neolewinella aquimaris TaxID=1835722 RepID=A0A840E3M6_9BACT|nr:hypothetical protein [Neolewinella aquimaris]MBB4080184.1 hypothetical protein [Neolewinella aquimaris]